MERNFSRSLREVLKHEGGYVNNKNDRGGATNKGVTIANFRAYVKPGGTIEDLKRLTTEQAGIVYRRFYWDKVVAGQLPNGVDFAVFDFAVNSGPDRAVKFLQRILGVPVDGAVGPTTLAAAKKMPAGELAAKLCDARLDWLKTLRGKSGWQTFGKGWERRVVQVRKVALDMAKAPEDAPVILVEEKAVPVPVPELDKPWYQSPEVLIPTVTPVLPGLAGFDWRVMIVAIVVGAAFAGYLIWRRSAMKAGQAAKVETINDRGLS